MRNLNNDQSNKGLNLKRSFVCLFSAVSGAFVNQVFAQTVPDAGQILQQQQQINKEVPILKGDFEIEKIKDTTPINSTEKLTVQGFKFSGDYKENDADLLDFLQPWVGKELSVAELHKVAAKLEKFLRNNKQLPLALAFIPPQDITDGIVEIKIFVGKISEIEFKFDPELRLDQTIAREFVENNVTVGEAYSTKNIERGMLLLNDVPGVFSRSLIIPSKQIGSSKLLIDVTQDPILESQLSADNYGSRQTGDIRLTGNLFFNDPSGHGDQATMVYSRTEYTDFFRGSYSLPFGRSGLRVGANYTYSRYSLGGEFKDLDANGHSELAGIYASYPLVRSRTRNVYIGVNQSARFMISNANSSTVSNKRAQVTTLTLNGNWQDDIFQGGINEWMLNWTNGQMDLSRWEPSLKADALADKTNGNYQKIGYSFNRLQRIDEDDLLAIKLTGQYALKRNLDSSEIFTLGGVNVIRAYPSGDAGGNTGYVLSAEWKRNLTEKLQMGVFYDYGEIKLLRHPSDYVQNNRYHLEGAGISLGWTPLKNVSVNLTVGQKLDGHNPGADANGNDSDGRKDRTRVFVSVSGSF